MRSDDVRSMYESLFLGAWDMDGRDVTVTIAKVEGGTLTSPGGKTSRKPIVYFERTNKALPLNKSNLKAIAGMYGFKARDWVGKRITLYPTTTTFGAETVDAIRVRPGIPSGRAKSQGIDGRPVDPKMRAKQDRAAEAAAKEADPIAAANAIDTDPTDEPNDQELPQ